jgi:release factor glutamine methyltransferase
MQAPPQRVGDVLNAATARLSVAGSETARLDAEVLLAHILGIDRSILAAHPEAVLSTGQLAGYESHVTRREAGEPVAYIRGVKEFYGTAISVDRRVLIPRPETETLVELALTRIAADLSQAPRDLRSDPYLVWDVGTGSGAIAIAIGKELRRRRYGDAVRFFASDISADARDLATINVVSQGLAHLFTFAEGDLLDVAPAPPGPADLLLANLPYVPTGTIPTLAVAASFEPTIALDGGSDGLAVIRRLLANLPGVLASGGAALLEIGDDQAAWMTEAVAELLPGWSCTIHPDLSGHPRVARIEGSHA